MGRRSAHTHTPLPRVYTVRENVENGVYKTKLPYGVRPTKPNTKIDISVASDKEIADVRAAMAKYEADEAAFTAARLAYSEDERRLHDLFVALLAEENGMTGHPKAGKVYAMAYDRGHSGGMGDVITEYEELVDLVKN